MFGWEFPPHISGGLGTACFGLTKGLATHGINVTFVLPKLEKETDCSHIKLIGANRISLEEIQETSEVLKNHVSFLTIDSPLTPYATSKEYNSVVENISRTKTSQEQMLSTELSGNYGPDIMSEIFRYSSIASVLAEKGKYDVIHAHDWMTFPAGIEAKRRSGKPLVVHIHALEFDRSGEAVNQDVFNVEREGMNNADLVITVSQYTKNIIIQRYNIPKNKVRVVHNAVSKEKHPDTHTVRKVLKEKIVLFLGRITFQKGPEYFIEAAHKVINMIPGVRFVMAGTGDMFPRMVELAARYRIGRYFHFTGFLKGKDVDRMYAMSDLYVMPSVSEPFGISPLEAMVYDKPVIVSKQSGVAELLQHAIKVDFWDIDKLAENIISVLTRPDFTQRMIIGNGEQLAEISWDKAADEVISVYHEVVGQ